MVMVATLDSRKLLARILAVAERSQRRSRFAELVAPLEVEELAPLLASLLNRVAREREWVPLLLAFFDWVIWPQASYQQVADLYRAASDMEQPALQAALLAAPPRERYEAETQRMAHPDLAEETLGRRRSLARGQRLEVLEKLLLDPDPLVVRHLLANPRTTLDWVVRITARRPNLPEVLEEVYRSDRWVVRREVLRALVLNPYAAPALAAKLVALLPRPDLAEVAARETLSPMVRRAAGLYLQGGDPETE